MFVLLWSALLFSVRSNNAQKDLTVTTERLNTSTQAGFGTEQSRDEGNCIINVTSDSGWHKVLNGKTSQIGKIVRDAIPLTEGQQTKLTCTAHALCSGSAPTITWTWRGRGENNSRIPGIINEVNPSTLTFVASAEHHNTSVTCMVSFNNMNTEVTMTLSVKCDPKILNSSGCTYQSEVLVCTCISHGFPLPSIKWPLLMDHSKHSVLTMVSKQTINSTFTLTVSDQINTTVECHSSNENGEVTKALVIQKGAQKEEEYSDILKFLSIQWEKITAFFIGAFLCGFVCCLTRKCCRKKQKTFGNLPETLEMVTAHEAEMIDAGQAEEEEQAIYQEAAEPGGGEAAGKPDVEYSDLDFSLIKRENPAETGMTQGSTETEYAEIKKEKAKQGQDGQDREDMEMEDEETNNTVPDEEEGEDVALYSTVKDLEDQI